VPALPCKMANCQAADYDGLGQNRFHFYGCFFTYTVSYEIVAINPCRGIKYFPDQKCMRLLSQQEIVRLCHALKQAEEGGENLKSVANWRQASAEAGINNANWIAWHRPLNMLISHRRYEAEAVLFCFAQSTYLRDVSMKFKIIDLRLTASSKTMQI
jgi:hypothetical protein